MKSPAGSSIISGQESQSLKVWRPSFALEVALDAMPLSAVSLPGHYGQTSATGATIQFRLMGALFGFAERLAVALDVPFQNRCCLRLMVERSKRASALRSGPTARSGSSLGRDLAPVTVAALGR
jgi:hypothetical protein